MDADDARALPARISIPGTQRHAQHEARLLAMVRDPDGVVEVDVAWPWEWSLPGGDGFDPGQFGYWPDLRDPATEGAALELVRRQAAGPVWLAYDRIREGWMVCDEHSDGAAYPSRAEALVAAMEAA